MKIKVLGSSVDDARLQFCASYLLGDSVAIDAGSIGFCSLAIQRRIEHVVLSHSHLDHIASLPIFLDNVYVPGPACPVVYGHPSVIECLQTNFFNGHVWPDLMKLSREESPFVKFVSLEHGMPLVIGGFQITPVDLNHVVPCFGFLIEDARSAVAVVSDTGPTDEIWKLARQNPKLTGVLLESAFPNSFAWLADKAKHLTPSSFLTEYRKLGKEVPVLAVHIKPAYSEQILAELHQLGLPSLTISEPGREYEL